MKKSHSNRSNISLEEFMTLHKNKRTDFYLKTNSDIVTQTVKRDVFNWKLRSSKRIKEFLSCIPKNHMSVGMLAISS